MFPDNSVLVNFAHMDRMSLFEELVQGRGRWTATVAEECEMSSEQPGLEGLAEVKRILGEPLRLSSTQEYLDTEAIRIQMSKPGDHRFRNLGEGETLAIIVNRADSPGAFVTDDQSALRKAKELGVRTCSTYDLITLAVRAQRLELLDGWNDIATLRAMPRFLPGATNFFAFQQRCTRESAA